MLRRYIAVFVFLLIFLSSCDLFPSEAPPASESPTETLISEAPAVQTEMVDLVEPTETFTQTPAPPTVTATPEPPTATATASNTATPQPPTLSPTVTPTNRLFFKPSPTPPFLGVQIGSPVNLPNFAHPELACQWMGVAGQIFDIDGLAIEGLVVELGGSLAGREVMGLAITGSAPFYGPGGYEFKLADQPLTSSGTAWVQVFDLEGLPLSAPAFFNTSTSCDQNLVLLNFVQSYTLPDNWVYLPLITR